VSIVTSTIDIPALLHTFVLKSALIVLCVGNACGTIGLLHTLMNLPDPVRTFRDGSWLATFDNDTSLVGPDGKPASATLRAERLEGDNRIANLHDQATASESNQTGRGSLEDNVETHFIALVHKNGTLYELDGRKRGPVDHGPTTQASLLRDACRVVREFMDRDPGELRFTLLALAPAMQSS
jgi:ubiquitin carboxyl-terminal hydrolase L3